VVVHAVQEPANVGHTDFRAQRSVFAGLSVDYLST
jgi:hypothetical protein